MTSHVYRCYDADGLLLYVGCTTNVQRRLSGHRNNPKTLASAVLRLTMDRVEVEGPFEDRVAERAEADAIRSEAPLLNLQMSGRPGWQQWKDVARYVEDRGIEIGMVGLARCAGCGWTCSHRLIHERGRCQTCLDCGDEPDYVEAVPA